MAENLIVTFVEKVNQLKRATPDTAIDPNEEVLYCKEYITQLLSRRVHIKDCNDGLTGKEVNDLRASTSNFSDRASCAFLDAMGASPDLPDSCNLCGADMFAAFTSNNRNSTEWVNLNGKDAMEVYKDNTDDEKGYMVFATKVNGKVIVVNIDTTNKDEVVVNTYSTASKSHVAENLCLENIKCVLQKSLQVPQGSKITGQKHFHEGLATRGSNELLGIWATFMVALHPWRSLGALDVSEEYLKEFSDQLVSCVSDGNPYICRKAIEFPECERIGCTHKRH